MKPMTEVHTQPGDNTNDPAYIAGYRAAQQDLQRFLADILRIHAIDTGVNDGEVLSDRMVRQIYAGVFGAPAAEATFGPEPTGSFDTSSLDDYRTQEDL